jgi:hypothetical protein
MDWSGTLEKYGWKMEQVGSEPFHPLALQAQQARAQGGAISRITANVGTSHDFGNVRVSFNVSIECVQSEATMNLAGESAFLKALELTNDGARFLGIPELPEPGR